MQIWVYPTRTIKNSHFYFTIFLRVNLIIVIYYLKFTTIVCFQINIHKQGIFANTSIHIYVLSDMFFQSL